MLNTDVATHILLLTDSLQDLRNTILTSRVFLDAYQQRRKLITGTVLRNEIRLATTSTPQAVLVHADAIVKRLKSNAAEDSIMIYEGIRPLIMAIPPARRGVRTPIAHFAWTLKLVRLYNQVGPSASNRKLVLLENAYADVLAIEPNFDSLATAQRQRVRVRLGVVEQNLCCELAAEYTLRIRLQDALQVKKNVIQRTAFEDAKTYEWTAAVMETYRALDDIESAVHYAMRMHNIARASNCLQSALSWARHIVALYSNYGQHAEASRRQEHFLTHIQPDTQEHIAWARQLVVLQKRAGYPEKVLSTKAAVWEQMTITNACYFGWARELADEYRKLGKGAQALEVIERMYREASRQSERYAKDRAFKFHAIQAARTLAAEYAYCGRSEDACSLLQQEVDEH